jgi:hypothetical protein
MDALVLRGGGIGAVGGEGSFHTRKGRGRLDYRFKNAVTAMLPAMPRHGHRSFVNLLLNGVIHLWMKTLNVRGYAPKSCSVVPKYLGSDG